MDNLDFFDDVDDFLAGNQSDLHLADEIANEDWLFVPLDFGSRPEEVHGEQQTLDDGSLKLSNLSVDVLSKVVFVLGGWFFFFF